MTSSTELDGNAAIHPFRRAIAWSVTVMVALGVALFLFAFGLIVSEAVIWPSATLATSVVAALVAAPLSDWSHGDGSRASINDVARRSLAWALLPALLILLFPLLVGNLRLILWIGLIAIYTTVVAFFFAGRYREPAGSSSRLRPTLNWLVGTVVALMVVIFIASLFGLTGA